jgi:FKBP-type peptidyl-prolyl cis-trans isomerase
MKFIIPSLLLSVLLLFSCKKDDDFKTPAEYLAEEQALLEEYLNYVDTVDNPDNVKTNLEILTERTVKNEYKKSESGLYYFETLSGVGDSIVDGNQVAFRYTEYVIALDDERPVKVLNSSNWDDADALDFIKGPNSGIYAGVEEAIENMLLGGKCIAIVPSPIGEINSYLTHIFEIEVTYVNR